MIAALGETVYQWRDGDVTLLGREVLGVVSMKRNCIVLQCNLKTRVHIVHRNRIALVPPTTPDGTAYRVSVSSAVASDDNHIRGTDERATRVRRGPK